MPQPLPRPSSIDSDRLNVQRSGGCLRLRPARMVNQIERPLAAVARGLSQGVKVRQREMG